MVLTALVITGYYETQAPVQTDSIEVYFCPEANCNLRVIEEINSATDSIDVAIYSFTLDEIGDALLSAHNRGVKVRVVFEKQQVSQYSEYWELLESGVEVLNDSNSVYMHNKFAVIDGKIVLTGSYNWSQQATDRNDENLLIIRNSEIADKYKEEFQEIFLESKG